MTEKVRKIKSQIDNSMQSLLPLLYLKHMILGMIHKSKFGCSYRVGQGEIYQVPLLLISDCINIFELYLSLRSNFYAIIYINKINFPLIQALQYESIRTLLIAILSITPFKMFIFGR